MVFCTYFKEGGQVSTAIALFSFAFSSGVLLSFAAATAVGGGGGGWCCCSCCTEGSGCFVAITGGCLDQGGIFDAGPINYILNKYIYIFICFFLTAC
jgi:hypothetical protein